MASATAWIAGFATLLLIINLGAVHTVGSFEYWFAMIKVVAIAAFILIGAGLLLGGGAQTHYTTDGGFLPHGAAGPLLALPFVLFNFLGTEMVAISSGEARSTSDIVRGNLSMVVERSHLRLFMRVRGTGRSRAVEPGWRGGRVPS